MFGRILIVDDDPSLCLLLSRFLSKHGFEVITASSIEDATALADANDLSLLITDFMMPGMDGIRFAQAVRSEPRHRDLTVLLVTAHPTDEVVERAMRGGIAMVLPKPIELPKLLALVGFATAASPGSQARLTRPSNSLG